MAKIFWQTAPKPTGRFRSFQRRGWPTGWSDRTQTRAIAAIRCVEDYVPANAKIGKHRPLKVAMAIKNEPDPNKAAWGWRTLKGEFATLAEAKTAAETFYNAHRNMFLGGDQ